MDPVEKAKGAMGSVERAVSNLPGIKGYREKDMRRDADKQVRDSLVQELNLRRGRISTIQQDLLSSGGLLWMDDVERVSGRLQLLIDRVRTAAYGYAPFFALERIKEDELDRLIAYDRALFEGLPKLDQAIDDLGKAVQANDNVQGALQAVSAVIADMGEQFGRRMEAILKEE